MDGIEFENFWTTSKKIEAFRVTEENIKALADFLGEKYIEKPGKETYFKHSFDDCHVGDWAVKYSDGRYAFFTDLEFKKFFLSHDQRLAEDEKYAKVFLLVKGAMNKQDSATYHDRGGSDEMSLVAIETTKALLREI